MLELFKIAYAAQVSFIVKDISGKENARLFATHAENILAHSYYDFSGLKRRVKTFQPLESNWWNHYNISSINRYQKAANDLALDLINSLEKRFITGGHNNTAEKYLAKKRNL